MAIDVGSIPIITDDIPDSFDEDQARDEIIRWDAYGGNRDRYQLAELASRLAGHLDLTERLALVGAVRARREQLLDTIRARYYKDESSGSWEDRAEAKESNANNDATFAITPTMPQYAILGLLYPNHKVGYHPEDGGMFDYSDKQKAVAALAINEGKLSPDFIPRLESSTIEL